MKKFMTAALALVLTLGMGVTVMAASVTKTVNVKNVNVGIEKVVDKDGNAVEGAKIEAVTEAVQQQVFNQATNYMNTFMSSSVDILGAREVTLDGVSVDNPVTITFTVEGVSAGNTIIVLHRSSVRGWEVLTPASVGNGTVTVTFTDLSPVAFLRPASAPAAPVQQEIHPPEYYEQLKAMYGGNTETNAAAATATVSPKTAQDNGIAGFVALAVVCTAAIAVTSRKKNA